jgi:hypothetical protein
VSDGLVTGIAHDGFGHRIARGSRSTVHRTHRERSTR